MVPKNAFRAWVGGREQLGGRTRGPKNGVHQNTSIFDGSVDPLPLHRWRPDRRGSKYLKKPHTGFPGFFPNDWRSGMPRPLPLGLEHDPGQLPLFGRDSRGARDRSVTHEKPREPDHEMEPRVRIWRTIFALFNRHTDSFHNHINYQFCLNFHNLLV